MNLRSLSFLLFYSSKCSQCEVTHTYIKANLQNGGRVEERRATENKRNMMLWSFNLDMTTCSTDPQTFLREAVGKQFILSQQERASIFKNQIWRWSTSPTPKGPPLALLMYTQKHSAVDLKGTNSGLEINDHFWSPKTAGLCRHAAWKPLLQKQLRFRCICSRGFRS